MRDCRIVVAVEPRLNVCGHGRPELSGGGPFDPFNLSADAERDRQFG